MYHDSSTMIHIPLSQYISDSGRRAKLAADMGASTDYLWQVASGWHGRRASPGFAELVEDKTNGVVPKEWVIWPPVSAASHLRKRAPSHSITHQKPMARTVDKRKKRTALLARKSPRQ